MMSKYLERNIQYFPCLAHRINTTVEHSSEASAVIAAMFDTLEMIYVFLPRVPSTTLPSSK